MYDHIAVNKRKTRILIAMFVVVVLMIGAAAGMVQGMDPVATIGIAAAFSIVMALVGYFKGDKVALASSRARKITKADNPYVYRMVENLCITAGIKTIPALYIINDPAINAFATGRDPEHSSIAVTTGAIEKLENEELEGVLAHELSHVQNYDIRIMTIVIVLVGMISLIADLFLRGMIFGGRGRSSDSRGGGILAVVGIVLIVLSPIIAKLIQMAVSRKREYLADASGSLLTRYPEGLARALEKIKAHNQPMRAANHATAHLFLESPFRRSRGGKVKTSWFDTHPPIDDRIAKLRSMA